MILVSLSNFFNKSGVYGTFLLDLGLYGDIGVVVAQQLVELLARVQSSHISPLLIMCYNDDRNMKKKYLIKTEYGSFGVNIWYDNTDKLYLVEVPSFDKTMTQGSTLADAKYMAKDLIELLCEVAFDDGKIVIDDLGMFSGKGKVAQLSGPVAILV